MVDNAKEERKELKEVLDELKSMPEADVSQQDIQRLEESLKEETKEIHSMTEALKDDAEQNQLLNKLQIAKDAFNFITERDNAKRTEEKVTSVLAEQGQGLKKQQKHNAGARDARDIILEQGKIGLQNDTEFRNRLDSIESKLLGAQKVATKEIQQSLEEGEISVKHEGIPESIDVATEELQAQQTPRPRQGFDSLGRRRGAEHFASDEELRAARGRATTAGEGQGELGTEALDTRMANDKVAKQRLRDEAAAKRQAAVVDINNLADDVQTTGKSQNIRKLSARELEEGGGLTLDEGTTIRAAGKNITRAGEYSTGTVKLRDVDTNEFTATDPLKAISEDIRISQGVIGTTRDRQQFRASTAAATISENIGNNAAEIQQAMDANPQAKDDLTKLVKAMEAQQKGEGSRKDVKVALEELKLSGGEDLAANLGLDQANKDLDGGGIGGRLKAGFKNFMGINQGTDILSGEAFGQVFDASRMFGDEGTSKIEMFRRTGDLEFKEEARRNKEVQSQVEAEQRFMGAEEGLDLADTQTQASKQADKKETWRDAAIPEEYRGEVAPMAPATATQMAEAAPEEAAGTGAAPKKSKREKMVDSRSGVSTESIPLQQLEVLKEIRDKLDNLAVGGGGDEGGDDGSMLDDIIPGKRKNKNKGKNKGGKNKPKGKMGRLASRAGGLFKGAGKMLSGNAMKIGGAALAVGAGAYTAYKGVTGAEEMADAGELTPEEEQAMKGEAVGEGVGQAGGALAGAKVGAMIGAFGGPVGAAVGGLIGGAFGFFAGGFLGKKAGGAVADVLPVNEEELKESEDQANATLDFAKEKDATLASKVEKDADDIYKKMIEEGGGEDAISDYDKRVTKNAALVKALLNHKEELQQAGIHRDGGGFLDELEKNSVVAKTGGASGATGGDIEMAQASLSGTEGTGATLTGTPAPTGQAVENMTRLGNEADQMMNQPVVVNNTVPQQPMAVPDNNKLVATVKEPAVRGDTSTIQRSHDKGFLA